MMVKRYVVKDMPEAVVLIRKDLGKDAVILSTKRITIKKWLGLWRNKRLEVLAAAGEDMPIRTSPPRRSAYGANAYTEAETAIRDKMRSNPSQAVTELSATADEPDVGSQVKASKPEQPTDVHSAVAQAEFVKLQSEIAEVKRLLEASLADERLNRLPVLKQLASHGVETSSILSMLQSSDTTAGTSVIEGLGGDRILSELRSHLSGISEAQPIAADTRIAAFVGPTGVGKTTTIAKIAALQMLSGHRRVGLLTTDTYRIAAVEQLRTYARILDIPLEVVYQAHEFDGALERLSDRDLILIDTAGRNFRQSSNVEDTRALLSRLNVDETHLVLSLTSKPEDLKQVAEEFMVLPVDKFLFTKLDETATYGAAVNLLYRYRKPLSYLTNGQSVPDDIEVASLDKLLKLICGGAA